MPEFGRLGLASMTGVPQAGRARALFGANSVASFVKLFSAFFVCLLFFLFFHDKRGEKAEVVLLPPILLFHIVITPYHRKSYASTRHVRNPRYFFPFPYPCFCLCFCICISPSLLRCRKKLVSTLQPQKTPTTPTPITKLPEVGP